MRHLTHDKTFVINLAISKFGYLEPSTKPSQDIYIVEGNASSGNLDIETVHQYAPIVDTWNSIPALKSASAIKTAINEALEVEMDEAYGLGLWGKL